MRAAQSGIDPHLEGAEHGEEGLADDKREQEVDGHCESLACGSSFQGLYLARHLIQHRQREMK